MVECSRVLSRELLGVALLVVVHLVHQKATLLADRGVHEGSNIVRVHIPVS